jgi:hypothetical protein
MSNHNLFLLLGMAGLALGCGDSALDGSGGQPPVGGDGSGAGDTGGQAPIAGGGSGGEGGAGTGGAADGGSGGSRPLPVGDVVWTNVVITDGCFLFSDPDQLGTNATWAFDGNLLTLLFDDVERQYAGTADGSTLTLQGDHEETYDREVWKYQEIFTGAMADGEFTGSWTYTECNFTVDPEGCPAGGMCQGKADFVIAMPPDGGN